MTKEVKLTYRQKLENGLISYRPDSNKAKVYRCFTDRGEEAAKKMALEQLKLKPSTFTAWKGDWRAIAENKWPSPLDVTKPQPEVKTITKKAVKRKAPAKKKAA